MRKYKIQDTNTDTNRETNTNRDTNTNTDKKTNTKTKTNTHYSPPTTGAGAFFGL